MRIDIDELVTADQAAIILGKSSELVRWYAKQGRLNSIKIGGSRLFHRDDLQEFMANYKDGRRKK